MPHDVSVQVYIETLEIFRYCRSLSRTDRIYLKLDRSLATVRFNKFNSVIH